MARLVTPNFDHAHPKKFWLVFNFCESVSTCKKSVYSESSFFRYSQFSITRLAKHIFGNVHPKIFNHLLICVNLCQHVKTQLISFVHSWDTASFRVQGPDWPNPCFDHAQLKIFKLLLIFVNLYQHAKNQPASSIYSGERVDLKILQCNWLKAVWHRYIFPKYYIQ